MVGEPPGHRRVEIALRQLAEEGQPHLLEIAREAVDQQAFPRVGGAHMRRQRLRPVEPQCLAQMGEGARHRDLVVAAPLGKRSEEHTSELQSLMRSSYAVFCLKTKQLKENNTTNQSLKLTQ